MEVSKIKILHVVHDFLFGGVEGLVYYLTQAQKKNDNIEVAILCCQKFDSVPNRRIIEAGTKCHFVEIKPWDLRLSQYQEIIQVANQYDIVHLHTFKPFLAFALSLAKSKILYTNHSAGEDGRQLTIGTRIKDSLLVQFLNKRVNFISNNSHYTKSFWKEKGVTNRPNEVIYNGVYFTNNIDESRAYTEYPILNNKFVVGTTSRFIKWKRVEKLIEAFFLFQKDKENVMLLLVGDGQERKHLEALVNKLGISKLVIFTGFKKNVIDFQSKIDVAVFASNCEPFGLVAVECMHLGIPTIVFKDGGGITELVEKVEPENIVVDVENLAEVLNSNFKNRLLDQNSKKEKRRLFSNGFDVINIEKEFSLAYKQMHIQ